MDLLFDQAVVGLAECDLNGRLLRVNDYFCTMVGRSRDDLVGRHLREIVHPDDLPVAEALLAGLASEDKLEVEKRYLRPDGSVVWTRTVARLLRTGSQVPTRALAVSVDITAYKQHEKALKESEERFRLLADAVPGVVWIANPAGEVTYANEYWIEYTGRPASEALGDAWIDVLHPDDVPGALRIWQDACLKGARYEAEFRYRRYDGAYRWHVVRANPSINPDTGEVMAWFGTATDIHEHKVAEAALRESEQRLRATYENAAIGIGEMDADGRYLRVNERLCAILGYDRDEMRGRTFHEITHPDDQEPDREQYRRLMAGELETYSLEKRYLHKDGHIVWGAVSASRVDDASGRPLYGVRVIRDISARKQAQEMRTLLVNELNHRVKNTLATVQSIVSQTLRNAGSSPQVIGDIESRLFALARGHDVLMREAWQGAALMEIVAQAIAPYQALGEGRFRVQGPDIRLNPQQTLALTMALQELATNAAKYGALSNKAGMVEMVWSIMETGAGRRLRLRWKESGGPPVEPPAHRGFGTRLIERGLASELGGEVTITFPSDGVECLADIPLRT